MSDPSDHFLFSVEGLTPALRVVRFAASEGLSELFHVELTFASTDAAIDLAEVVGRPALLTLLGDGGEPRHVHGVVSRFEQGETGRRVTAYHATLVPRVWRLQHRHDCRIFQELTTPAIVQKVLEGAGLAASRDFRFTLQGTYAAREYCVQYRESDWAFVCRLLEDEGIHWFFEHHEDRHVLVLGDAPSAHAAIPGDASIVFRPGLGALTGGEHVARFHYAGEVRPGRVTLRDYDFQKPALLLEGGATADLDGELEIYDYPGDHGAPGQGAGLAKIRLEERQVLRETGDGDSACERLVPGYTFTLAEHSREALNRAYLLTRVEHRGFEPAMAESGGGDAEARYENHFQVIPASVPFRPPRHTPRPTIKGVQSAVVVGPSGEEIYTDRFGRVKVQFHWDRLGKNDEKSSCWMRVSQLWAGEAWGAMHIPRVHQEVLVDFLEGDPDRPIVVGRVYHGTNVPPYGLPAERTKSTIKSNSSPGGGGSNELRFEDKKGSEEIYLHAQKDLDVAVEHDESRVVGHDASLHVKNDRALAVDVDQTEKIGHDRTRSVGNDETASIGRNRSISVVGDHVEEIGGAMTLSIAKALTEEVSADATLTVGGKLSLTVSSSLALDVTGSTSAKVGGSSAEQVELDRTFKVGSRLVIECGAARVTVDKSGKITIEGTQLEINGTDVAITSSGQVKIDASGPMQVKGSGPMSIDASGAVKLKGSRVGIN